MIRPAVVGLIEMVLPLELVVHLGDDRRVERPRPEHLRHAQAGARALHRNSSAITRSSCRLDLNSAAAQNAGEITDRYSPACAIEVRSE